MSFIPICDKPAILNKLEGLKLVLSSLCYILQDADTFLQYYITSNPITTDNQSTQNTVHTLLTALLKTNVCQHDGLIMGGNVFSSRILILLFNMHKMSSITVSINSGMKLQQNCCQTCISGMLINLLATFAFLQIGSKLPKKYSFLGSYCFSYSHLGAFDTVWKTTQFPLPTDKKCSMLT